MHTVLLSAVFTSLLLGNFARISFFNQLINSYVFEIFIVAHLIYLGLKLQATHVGHALQRFSYLVLFTGFLITSLVITWEMFTPVENGVALLYLLRFLLYTLYFIALVSYIQAGNDTVKSHRIFYFFAIVAACIAFLQYFFLPSAGALQQYGWDPHERRIFGTLLDTSAQSAFLMLFLFYTLTQLSAPALTAMLTVAVLFTYSRGGFIALLGTLLAALPFKRHAATFLIIALVGQFILTYEPKKPDEQGRSITRTGSVYSRMDDYKQGIRLFLEKPLLGWGYNHIRALKTQPTNGEVVNHAGASFHSSFLVVAVTSGVVGLILFTLALWQIAKQNTLSLLIVIALSLFSLFDNIWFYPHILVLAYIFIAYSLTAKTYKKEA